MLRSYQPPELGPHGHDLIDGIHDSVHAARAMDTRPTGQPLCPLVPDDHLVGQDYLATACPWCGTELQPGRDINVDMVIRRTLVTCPDPFCDFGLSLGQNDGLPVVVVDEEIYRLLPAEPVCRRIRTR